MRALRQRVLQSIRKEGLIPGGEAILVGVSGGPDSVCLLHILNHLKETLGGSPHVVHLNHMLRGVASDADADYVSLLAQSLGLPATVEARDVLAYKREYGLSLEALAKRYDSATEAEFRACRAEIRACRADIRGLNSHLQAVYESTSWRITGPLRFLGNLLKSFRAGLG